MTTDSRHADGDPLRLLSDARALARRVRLDQRLTWVTLLVLAVRVARARGLGARVMPYAITGAVTTLLFTAAWVAERIYWAGRALPADPQPTPSWVMFVDRLIGPWGTIGIALLVLARLERNLALFAFTAGYLAVVLVPINFGWVGNGGNTRMFWVPDQVISATVLLLGAAGFALARRRR